MGKALPHFHNTPFCSEKNKSNAIFVEIGISTSNSLIRRNKFNRNINFHNTCEYTDIAARIFHKLSNKNGVAYHKLYDIFKVWTEINFIDDLQTSIHNRS